MVSFDWDDANREHIAEHDVTPEEAEYVLLGDPLDIEVQIEGNEERLVQVGATSKGRILLVISVIRKTSIRVVTAYDAARRYRIAYHRWRGENYATEA